MPTRLRLFDVRQNWPAEAMLVCQSDKTSIANYVNAAQRRLLFCKEAGDEGWYGTWAEILFTINQDQPYWTATRDIARLEYANVCDQPVDVNNQFLEYLNFGNGRFPKTWDLCHDNPPLSIFSRNNVPTFIDLSPAPQYIAVYLTDSLDAGKRVLIEGWDTADTPIYSQDVLNRVGGQYVTLESPFVTCQTDAGVSISFNRITGVQKDVTNGPVQIYQVDPTTGDQVLLLTMQPSETTGSYRRYYFHNLPKGCCTATGTVSDLNVTALAKLELVPVSVDSDYLLIQNLEAILEECQAVRYSRIDTIAAKQMAQEKHLQAVRYLNGELNHYLGGKEPAVLFAPFGSAHLEHKRIGTMI